MLGMSIYMKVPSTIEDSHSWMAMSSVVSKDKRFIRHVSFVPPASFDIDICSMMISVGGSAEHLI